MSLHGETSAQSGLGHKRWRGQGFTGCVPVPRTRLKLAYIFRMAETLAELKTELVLLEKQLSRISQHADMDKAVTECANKIAATKEKIKKTEAGQ
jgi:hypothetical protein